MALLRERRHGRFGVIAKYRTRFRVADTLRCLRKRPNLPKRLPLCRRPTEQSRTNPKQNCAAFCDRIRLSLAPGKWAKERAPAIFETRQFRAGDSGRDQGRGHGLQTRFRRRRYAIVEILKSVPPPRHTDRTQLRGERRGKHICEDEIDIPERAQGWTNFRRRRLDCYFPGAVQSRSVNDSRRPLPPRPRRRP